MTERKQWQTKSVPYAGIGARALKGGACFCVEAAPQDQVSLVLYETGAKEELVRFDMRADLRWGRMRTLQVQGIRPARIEYLYEINGTLKMDPAARLVSGMDVFGQREEDVRARLLTRSFAWGEDQAPRIPYEEVIAYALHVRGFTKGAGSGVHAPGTFRGLTEKIPYLCSLGINQVILMPAYAFDEVETVRTEHLPPYLRRPEGEPARERINFWGYTDGWYFAPKSSYAVSDAPDTEFKTMVRGMHARGIEVIMEFAFPDTMSLSCASQVLAWWASEYHVDGFLLMMRRDLAKQLAADPVLGGVKILGDYLDMDDPMLIQERKPRRLADCNGAFQTAARRLLKGDEGALETFAACSRKGERDKGIYHYLTSHDGMTLMDLVSYDKKHNEANGQENLDGPAVDYSWNCGVEGPTRRERVRSLRLRQMKNAFAMLLLSQGTPIIRAGDECCNSQSGNNNPWCQDNEVGWVSWSRQLAAKELTQFVRTLTAFRRAHPILHTHPPLTGTGQTGIGYPDYSVHSGRAWYSDFSYQSRELGVMLCSDEEAIYVAWNFHWESRQLALPYLSSDLIWQRVLRTDEEETGEKASEDQPTLVHERQITVPGRCVWVLQALPAGEEKQTRTGSTGKKKRTERKQA